MNEELEIEPTNDYLTGYNEGYTLAKYMPDLAAKLSDVLGDSERGKGFIAGKEQLSFEKERDKNMERYTDWLTKDEPDIGDRDLEMDKDEYEPEKE